FYRICLYLEFKRLPMKKILATFVLFFAAMTVVMAADSIADIAKKEKERRAKVTKPAKVITNQDIEEFKAKGEVTSGIVSTSGAAEEATTTDQNTDQTADQKTKGVDPETQWKTKYTDANTEVEDAQKRLEE